MDEQYYWIEVNFPLFGFWGTVFTFWGKVKRMVQKLSKDTGLTIFRFTAKSRIRGPA